MRPSPGCVSTGGPTKKPKFLGLLTGAVAGLATITPAAGYVSPSAACLIGLSPDVVCFYAVALKNRLGWDDALDVWGVHGVGGFIGIILCGVFATTLFNPAGADGLLRGNTHFFLVQVGAVLTFFCMGFYLYLRDVLAHRSRYRRQG